MGVVICLGLTVLKEITIIKKTYFWKNLRIHRNDHFKNLYIYSF